MNKSERRQRESSEVGDKFSQLGFFQKNFAVQFFIGYISERKEWPAVKIALEKAIERASKGDSCQSH